MVQWARLESHGCSKTYHWQGEGDPHDWLNPIMITHWGWDSLAYSSCDWPPSEVGLHMEGVLLNKVGGYPSKKESEGVSAGSLGERGIATESLVVLRTTSSVPWRSLVTNCCPSSEHASWWASRILMSGSHHRALCLPGWGEIKTQLLLPFCSRPTTPSWLMPFLFRLFRLQPS